LSQCYKMSMKLPVSDHLNVDVFHFTNTWVMAFTSLCFIVNILLTFANTLRCMVSQFVQYSSAGTVLAFVWKMNGLICCKMSLQIYTVTIRCLPTHNHDVDVFSMATTMTWTIIWDGKLARSIIHLDATVIMKIATVMVTTFGATSKLCLTHVFDIRLRSNLLNAYRHRPSLLYKMTAKTMLV